MAFLGVEGMLGDPSQLPSPGRRDIFGTHLWRTFTILIQIKRCRDPVLSNVLTKVRIGICDEEVVDVLSNIVQPPDVDSIELDRTVVICSTRKECSDIISGEIWTLKEAGSMVH